MSSVSWTVKHKPQSLSEVIGNRETIQQLVSWLRSWDAGVPKKRAAFLFGSPGVGKTVTVEALAHDFESHLVERNASDYRTEDAINRFAGLASQFRPILGGRSLILLDEVDGLSGSSDRGGVKAITDVVKNAQQPIVMTANSAYDPKLAVLRSYCLMLEFKKPSVGEILKRLKVICERESLQADESALKYIAQRSEGDVRSALTDLQAVAQGKDKLGYDDVSWIGYRDRKDTIFNVLRMIFYGKTCSNAKRAVDTADVDIDMLFQWIYENIPDHFTDPRDLSAAMEALATADVYRGRIRASQDWSLLRYVIDFMACGLSLARKYSDSRGWIPFRFPTRIQMLSRSKAERAMQLSIGKKIRRRCHVSAVRGSKDILPYLEVIFRHDAEMGAGLSKWLDLDEEMVQYVAGTETKARAIFDVLGLNQ